MATIARIPLRPDVGPGPTGIVRRGATFTAILVLVLLSHLPATGAEEKRLEESDSRLKAEVNEAIRSGSAWLRSRQEADGSFSSPYEGEYPMGPTALSLLALLHCGVPRSDPAIRKGFDHLRTLYDRLKAERPGRDSGLKVYSVSITIMALAQLGRIEAEPGDRYGEGSIRLEKPDLGWMREMTRWLIGVQQSNGAWRYPHGGYDNSNSQYAILALKEARRVGIRVPDGVLARALDHWLRQQEKDGPKVLRQIEQGGDGVYAATRSVTREWDRARGWRYIDGQAVTGSMTTAGVAAVAILRSELLSATLRARAERAMRDGLAWLGKHFSVTGNPGGGNEWHYYYIYGLERAGVLAQVVWMGGHRWYAEGARYLVNAQDRRGGWSAGMRGMGRGPGRGPGGGFGGRGDVVETCFALLFLVRSTARSYGVPTPHEPVSLAGGDRLTDRALGDVFRAAFAELPHVAKERQRTRAREFALLGPRVIALLLPRLSDSEESIRERAVVILQAITGLRIGYDPSAPQAERESMAERWMLWYMTHRDALTLDPATGLIR